MLWEAWFAAGVRGSKLLDPEPLSLMSFVQQLANNAVQARQQAQRKREGETQKMMLTWTAEIKDQFMKQCEAASREGRMSCTMLVDRPTQEITSDEVLLQHLRGMLTDLGFRDGSVSAIKTYYQAPFAKMTGRWTDTDDVTSSISEPLPAGSGGVMCPICHDQHPPVPVVLVPCGHVVCRDCYQHHQMKWCPMCREATTSATRGLFMS